MDEGLGHPHLNEILLAATDQAFGLTNSEALLPAGSSRALQPLTGAGSTDFAEGVLPDSQTVTRTSRSLDVSHASPLAPLRSRDRQALAVLFDADNLSETTLDIHRCLARMYPEPCWDDEPYDFLHGYV